MSEKQEQQNTERSRMLGTMEMRKLVPTVSVPIMVSMLVQALYNIVDGIFVGQYSPDALTAVNLAMPMQMLMIAVSTGMGTGINSLISRRLGEKRPHDARDAARHGILIEVVGWLLFVIVGLFFARMYIGMTNPKGTVLVECGKMLEKGGYVIKSLNTINFRKSMHYNPFSYIRSEKDILKLVNTIIVNTKGDGDKSGEDFWVKAEKLYYTALIGYIWYEAPDHEKNFTTLLEMINASEAREDDETFKNPVDVMFDELEARDPDHFAVKQYRKYKLAAGKTAKSILISCGARLAPFDIAELRELMSYDEMELDTIGDRKTALFVIISDTDDTFNFVVAIMYSQLFNLLCDKADDVYNGRLPVHVRCLLDEFANIGQIPKFDKLIATIRSREISASIILQSQSQLKTIYKDAADTITGNCDCTLFLGGKEKSTLKEISEVLGRETIDLYNTSETRSNNNSYGLNYQKTGKELMSQDEIAVMDGAKCILQLRGVRPFLSNKYDITKHPKYRQLSDYNKRNAFDIEKYRQHKLVVKPDDTFDLYDMGEVEAD